MIGHCDTISSMTPKQYLKRPYTRLLIPDERSYCAMMLEFPGCITCGDTPDEAIENLELAATGWIKSALARGLKIPEPVEENQFSGRLILRMSRAMHRQAVLIAARERVSLNHWLIGVIGRAVGMTMESQKPRQAKKATN